MHRGAPAAGEGGTHRLDQTELVGLVAGTLTTLAFVPQAVRTLRLGSARDFSPLMLGLFVSGIVLWLAYGLMAGLTAVIAANGATLALTAPIVWVKLRKG